jgi:hypothetical protein
MRANPGGTIGPKEVIGRDGLVTALWQALETQSLVLTSERRIGKTTLIRKMKQEVRAIRGSEHPFCVMRDLEGLRTPQEFIDSLYTDIEDRLSKTERLQTQFWGLLGKLGGAQIGDLHVPKIGQHWKKLLFALIDDLCRQSSELTIFFWDELPLFIYNVKKAEGEAAAMEVLDVLRAIRQEYATIRMVFTGSVGLHQVLSSLRKEGYANAPTNDMRTVEVPPLDRADGAMLAGILLDGEELRCGASKTECSECISELAGHVPYYIHGLVARLSSDREEVTETAIANSLAALLADPNDPAHFRYYRERIRTYYSTDEEAIALAVLDGMCALVQPTPFAEILNRVRHRVDNAGEEAVRDVIHLLGRDHYLNRTIEGRWSFRYEIVRRWWQMERK